jgi:hypothetical protein
MGTDDRLIKGHCPRCGKGRNAFVRREHIVEHPDAGDGVSAADTGMILECCGCNIVYFRRDYWLSEWDEIDEHPVTGQRMLVRGIGTSYWPSPVKRTRPAWLSNIEAADRQLHALLEELYVALDSDLRVLAAIGARTAFDRASELLGVEPALRFEEKLFKLGADGKISINEEETLQVLVDAGSAAAHSTGPLCWVTASRGSKRRFLRDQSARSRTAPASVADATSLSKCAGRRRLLQGHGVPVS